MTTLPTLSAAHAAHFADLALANVAREYPNKPDHVVASPDDLRAPRVLHPSFYGSFDWHSCVHMHWLLVRVRRLFPALPQRADIDALLDRHFAPQAIAAEVAYLAAPEARAFERTYGWAWLLKLAEELSRTDDADARRWSGQLAPLAAAFVARYLEYLPRATYPIRYGIHPNSAFGLMFAVDYARTSGALPLAELADAKARAWFADDREAPASWEPSGADFFSPTLIEADLMRRVLAPAEYSSWLAAFLPGLADGEPATLFAPANVSARTDPQMVHLDGLNLSRAWCWRGIAATLPPTDPRRAAAHEAAAAHLAAGLVGVDGADYVGAHWLATFATLALAATSNA
jgi:Protein of unknown function (DUF2891)